MIFDRDGLCNACTRASSRHAAHATAAAAHFIGPLEKAEADAEQEQKDIAWYSSQAKLREQKKHAPKPLRK